jgi:hypothetical protein
MTNSERLVFLPMVIGTILCMAGLVLTSPVLEAIGGCLVLPFVFAVIWGCSEVVLQMWRWLVRRK